MIQEIFSNISAWLSVYGPLAYVASFLWGLASILISPCGMGSFPLVVAYVAGQRDLSSPKKAIQYGLLFSLGLFSALSLVGITCSLMGRLLGDVGTWLQVAIGVFLVWLGSRLFFQRSCSIPFPFFQRIALQGRLGAFIMGGAYGVVAGPCTFGFIAPLLAIITVGSNPWQAILMITMFSVGHCLPLILASISVAGLKAYLESRLLSNISFFFQKGAGVLIVAIGIYFALNPFLYALSKN